MSDILDDYEKKHFIRWAESGHCPSEVYDDPELALAEVEDLAASIGADEIADVLDRHGWPRVWEMVEQSRAGQ